MNLTISVSQSLNYTDIGKEKPGEIISIIVKILMSTSFQKKFDV